jgi:Fic-DOC domain mobile mystery protein B
MALGLKPGATPLDPDEAVGLIPRHITTQAQLNEWEFANILDAQRWAFGLRRRQVLDDKFARDLHKRMFGKTWRWAGQYRTSEKNIGIAPGSIAVELRNLVKDVRAQLEARAFSIDELAARFHHRLTVIHPFANGNGRHARLMIDVLLKRQQAELFTWGKGDLVRDGEVRGRYIDALRAADRHDYGPLVAFVRS